MRSKKEKWLKESFENETLSTLIVMRNNMKVSLANSKTNNDSKLIKALTRNLQIIHIIIARKEKQKLSSNIGSKE